jgi:CRP-like cAMP-binding protein
MAEDTKLYQRFGRSVSPGEVVFSEGDSGDQMFIIQEGRVKISKSIGGREHVLSTMGKGDFFGEMAIVNNVSRTATVTALTNVHLLAFNREGFLSMINKNAKIALNIIDKLCRRLQNMNVQIQQLVKRDSRGLIASSLNYAFQGAEAQGGSLYLDRATQEIAYNLQLPMDTVRGEIEQFATQGVVSINGNQITLSDAAKLEKLSAG